jgi:hypothetical protein
MAHAAEQSRAEVKEAREAWLEGQIEFDPEKLVFLDETGATTKMARLYGRALRGERVRRRPIEPAASRPFGCTSQSAGRFPESRCPENSANVRSSPPGG